MAPTVGPVSAVTAVVMALAFPFWNFQADVSQRPEEVIEIMPAPEVASAKVPVQSPKMLGADKSKPSTSEAMEFWPQWLTPLHERDLPQGLTLLHETGPAFLFMCATALVAATTAVILCMTCIKRRRVHSHIEPQKYPEGEGHGNTATAGRLLITFEEGVRAEEIMEEVKVLPMVTRTELLSIGIANADVTDMDAGDRALKGISGVASVESDAAVTIAGNPGVLPEQPMGFDGAANPPHVQPQEKPEEEGHGKTATAGRLLITFEEGVRAEEIMEEVKALPMVTYTDLLSIGIASVDVTDMIAGDCALKGISGVASVESDAAVNIAGNPGVLPEQPTGFDDAAHLLLIEPQEKPEEKGHGNTAMAGRLLITFEEGVRAEEIMEEVKLLPMVTRTELLSIGIANADVTDMDAGDRALKGISGVASVESDATVTIAGSPEVLPEQPTGFDGEANHLLLEPSEKPEDEGHGNTAMAGRLFITFEEGVSAQEIMEEVKVLPMVTYTELLSIGIASVDVTDMIVGDHALKGISGVASVERDATVTIASEPGVLAEQPNGFDGVANSSFNKPTSDKLESARSHVLNFAATRIQAAHRGCYARRIAREVRQKQELEEERQSRVTCRKCRSCRNTGKDFMGNICSCEYGKAFRQLQSAFQAWADTLTAESDALLVEICTSEEQRNAGFVQDEGASIAQQEHETSDLPNEFDTSGAIVEVGEYPDGLEPHLDESGVTIGSEHAYETDKRLVASEDDEAAGIATDAALNESCPDIPLLGQQPPEKSKVELEAMLAEEAETMDEDILRATCGGPRHDGGVAQTLGLGPAWTRGEIEAPRGVKDMGTWTSHVYTAEQQERLGVDETGKPLAASEDDEAVGIAFDAALNESSADLPSLGQHSPENSRVELESMLAEEAATMDEDIPQAADGVPRHGCGVAQTLGLGPAWTRGEIEAPRGVKDMGTWTSHVYTAEQQERLGVDETGEPVFSLACNQDSSGYAPERQQQKPRVTGNSKRQYQQLDESEPPAGVKVMGGRSELVYTLEQQQRLGVDEWGFYIEAGEPERPKSEYTGEQLVSDEATLAENFDENELRQEDVKQTPIKLMKEPAQCSPLVQRSPLPVSRSRGRPLQRRSSPV